MLRQALTGNAKRIGSSVRTTTMPKRNLWGKTKSSIHAKQLEFNKTADFTFLKGSSKYWYNAAAIFTIVNVGRCLYYNGVIISKHPSFLRTDV